MANAKQRSNAAHETNVAAPVPTALQYNAAKQFIRYGFSARRVSELSGVSEQYAKLMKLEGDF